MSRFYVLLQQILISANHVTLATLGLSSLTSWRKAGRIHFVQVVVAILLRHELVKDVDKEGLGSTFKCFNLHLINN